jgi:hypothetical protein
VRDLNPLERASFAWRAQASAIRGCKLTSIPNNNANSASLLLYISGVTGENHILPHSQKKCNFLKTKKLKRKHFAPCFPNISDLNLIPALNRRGIGYLIVKFCHFLAKLLNVNNSKPE